MSTFLPDSDSDNDHDDYDDNFNDLVVNKAYADKFEEKERQRELERAKYLGLDDNDDDDDDDEEEDDDAELLSSKVNLQVIQTINSLRKKDPKIYDPSNKWFDNEESDDEDDDDDNSDDNNDGKKQSKKKRFKDVLREQLLEDVEKNDDDDDNNDDDDNDDDENLHSHEQSASIKSARFNYDQVQDAIRRKFLDSVRGGDDVDDDDEDDEDDDILVVKDRDPREIEAEKKELQKALREMSRLAPKDHKEEVEKDAFLTNYISNEKWKDKQLKYSSRGLSADEVDDEEKELDKVDRFESKYNFRFEELQEEGLERGVDDDEEDADWKRHLPITGGAYQVQGHSRNVEGSVRRVDESRKQLRESRVERKARELRQKQSELMRLKNLKKQEVSSFLLIMITITMMIFWDTYKFIYTFIP